MRDSEWTTAEALQGTLGIGRSTFYRRVQTGEIEHAEIGGSKLYRPAVRVAAPSQSGPVPRDEHGQSGTKRDSPRDDTGQRDSDRTGLLALVTRYETRIDALLAEHQAATQRAAALAVELEAERGRSAAALEAERGRVALAQLEAEHARQLAERDRAREAAAAAAAQLEAERAREAARLEVERAREAARDERREAERERAERERAEAKRAANAVELERLRANAVELERLRDTAASAREEAAAAAQEERKRREAAEARAEAVEALARLSWWRFGAKRRARAALEGRMLGR